MALDSLASLGGRPGFFLVDTSLMSDSLATDAAAAAAADGLGLTTMSMVLRSGMDTATPSSAGENKNRCSEHSGLPAL